MSKKSTKRRSLKNPVGSILTGRFLLSSKWEKNWPFIIYLSLLALIMIASSHNADKKVHKISQLSNQMKELNSEYIDTRSRLMTESMETKVVEKASELGLKKSDSPPVILKKPEE